jgi:hypothetical protein
MMMVMVMAKVRCAILQERVTAARDGNSLTYGPHDILLPVHDCDDVIIFRLPTACSTKAACHHYMSQTTRGSAMCHFNHTANHLYRRTVRTSY